MTSKTKAARDATLGFIQAAQVLLYKAAQASSDLQGWAGEWKAIGDTADGVKALWHKVNNAPLPTGHDAEPEPAARPHRCMEDRSKLTDR